MSDDKGCDACTERCMGLLVTPSDGALKVFEKTIENDPQADMKAVPNQWVLNARGLAARFSEDLLEAKEEITALQSQLNQKEEALGVLREAASLCLERDRAGEGKYERNLRIKTAIREALATTEAGGNNDVG